MRSRPDRTILGKRQTHLFRTGYTGGFRQRDCHHAMRQNCSSLYRSGAQLTTTVALADSPDMAAESDESWSAGPLHVLLVLDDDVLRRFGPVLRRLCVGFVDESIRATILCPAGTDPQSLLVGMAKAVRHGSLRWLLRDRSVRKVVDALRGNEPNLVHAMAGAQAPLARALATQFDIPMVVQLTGLADLSVLEQDTGDPAVEYVAMTSPILQAARRVLGAESQRVTLIQPGLHALAEPTCFTADRETVTLLSYARFAGNCGLMKLLAATRELIRRNEDLMLFLMGTGPLEPQLRRRVIELGLLKSVTFTGAAVNRQAAMEGADVFVSTRRQTELRTHALEAMAAGMAIVAAKGSVNDFLIDEETALLFDPGSPDQLSIQLAQLLEHRDMARALAARAQEHVRKNHQPSAMVSATSELYRRLAFKQRTMKIVTSS